MKIGIVTQPLNRNYGGILQNYALQQVMRRLGHEPITIDYTPITPLYIWFLSCCKTVLYRIRGNNREFMNFPKALARDSSLMEFVEKYISRTDEVHKYLSSLIDEYQLEACVVGSDQTWRPRYNSFVLYDMFLRFTKNHQIKRIAYAASFGVDDWEFSKRKTKECKKLVRQFDAISVREQSGIELCHKYLNIDAIEVLDPTLLLSVDDYSILCSSVSKRDSECLVAYVLDITDEKKNLIERIAKERNLKLEIFTADKAATLTVEEWLAMFRDAAFVVTDSFHGTVFSIINNKPFLSIANENRGLSRFHSLLQKFGLEDRLITNLKSQLEFSEIEWEEVNNCITKWKNLSLIFINKSLADK